ncbi:MAG: TylF/MycF/NovP-related O-methyltransferase [bacterium]|nr:TylF/MycF/NovP-related O-methyltransferase [bacterium]
MPIIKDYIIKTTLKGIENTVGLFGKELSIGGERGEVTLFMGLPKDMDPAFQRIYKECRPYTMTSVERMYALYQATKYIIVQHLPGDFVECGVWRGGSVMLVAKTLKELGVTDRRIHLFDTFKGMTTPTDRDARISDNLPATSLWKTQARGDYNEYAYAPLEDVQRNLSTTGYPEENFVIVAGPVEETLPRLAPPKIALLRLDTDWYESTKHELEHLFPLLVQNGILIIDDYGHFTGARDAVDEYFKEKGINLLLNRVDYTGRLAINTAPQNNG